MKYFEGRGEGGYDDYGRYNSDHAHGGHDTQHQHNIGHAHGRDYGGGAHHGGGSDYAQGGLTSYLIVTSLSDSLYVCLHDFV